MNNIKQEIIEALKTNTMYDYISENYWKIDPAVLTDIIKEVDFVLYQEGLDKEINAKVAESLETDRWSDEE